MGLHIFRSSKKLGIHTNKIDPEPYFFRWEACIALGSKDQPELAGQPCYKHKTCGHLVASPHNRIPPKICVWCGANTVREAKDIEILEKQGVKIIDYPTQIVTLREASFGKVNQYLAETDE